MQYPLLSLKKMDSSMLLFELSHVTNQMSQNDAQMVTSAAELASYLHRNQRRYVRDDLPTTPYIEHPLRNALRINRWGGGKDPELLTMALLHDTVEDCYNDFLDLREIQVPEDTTIRQKQAIMINALGKDYSVRVQTGLSLITNRFLHPKDDYLTHVKRYSDIADFTLLKASDLHDNAGSLKHQVGSMPDEKIRKRIDKYTPAIQEITKGLESALDDSTSKNINEPLTENALASMRKLETTLNTLSVKIPPLSEAKRTHNAPSKLDAILGQINKPASNNPTKTQPEF